MEPITESQYFSLLKQEIPAGLSKQILSDLKLVPTIQLIKMENKFFFDFVEIEMFSKEEIKEIKCDGTIVTLNV